MWPCAALRPARLQGVGARSLDGRKRSPLRQGVDSADRCDTVQAATGGSMMQPREVLKADEIRLSDLSFWLRPTEEREGAFATLRRERPISFHEEPWFEGLQFPRGPGYWAITRYHDILEVSRTPEVFCSGQGVNIVDMPPDFREFFGSMINMDDPRHARLRRIVSSG